MAYAYYAGGADDERLLSLNAAAWAHWQLHPRVLAGIAAVDLSTTVLGTMVSSPVVVAPLAIQGLAHTDGEAATARGAEAVGALMVLSALATCSLEEVAAAAPDVARWMQVYILRDRNRTAAMVQRAAAHGYGALVLTVDAPVPGLRLRELRGDVRLPPTWPYPIGPRQHGQCLRRRIHGGGDTGVPPSRHLTPDDIGWLAGLTPLPVVAKGVQRADDAVRCVEAGAAALVVSASNHGLRQLADAPATADILGGDRRRRLPAGAEVYVDGGIRRAPDVVKALALGARAVLIGRPLRCGRWRSERVDGVALTPALVRNGTAASHGALRRSHRGRRSIAPWCDAPRAGATQGAPITPRNLHCPRNCIAGGAASGSSCG